MKKTFKSVLCLVLIVSMCIPAFAEVLIQPMPDSLTPCGITPLTSHPRLLLTEEDLPLIKENFDKSQNVSAYNEMLSKAFMETDGILPQSENFNYDENVIAIIEAKAFYSLVNNDEAMAQKAISAITNYVSTLNYDEHTELIYHVSSHVVFVAAEVYDWCYKYFTDAEKDLLIEKVQQKLLKTFNYGYPYKTLHNATAFSNQTTLNMIIKDALGFSIAIYDEYPDMFNYLSSVIVENFVDGRNYWYKSGKNPSGTSYGVVRHYADMWLDTIFFKATGVKLLTDDVYKAAYEYLYLFNPDSVHFRESDDNWYQTGGTNVSDYKDKSIYADLIMSSSKLKDGYLKSKALMMEEWIRKQKPTSSNPTANVPWNYSHTQFTAVQYLILNNPDVEADDISKLPKTYYMGEPDGTMLARTGWDNGYQTDVATAFMKIGGQQLYNHNHFDYGTFQLHYKGNLLQDLGVYTFTTSPGYEAHNISTVSHNGLLIYDPDEAVRFSTYNATYGNENSGGQQVKFGLNGSGNNANSLADYDEKFFDRADVINHYSDEKYSYISGDITKAYSDKVSDVKRSMIFMPTGIKGAPAVFMVMDKITSTEKRYKKSFLFQCLTAPHINGNSITLQRPSVNNKYFGSEVTNQILAPSDFEIKAIGGPGKQWFVNGTNYTPGPDVYDNIDTRVDLGWGRIEISPSDENLTDYFLNVMYVNDIGKYESVQKAELVENETFLGGTVLNQLTLFVKDAPLREDSRFSFSGDTKNIVITGLSEGVWQVRKNGNIILDNKEVTKDSGSIQFESDGGEFVIYKLSSPEEAEENTLFGGGNGTKENPYKIYTKQHFYNIENENSKYYLLMNDIILDDNAKSFVFNGTFDGDNHSITVNISRESSSAQGLFSKLTRSSTVKNLTVKGFVSGYSYVGGLAGEATGRIINVKNYASVYAKKSYAGGIAGNYNSSYDRIKNCVNYGPVYSSVSYAGGICGQNTAVIIYSGNYGNVYSPLNSGGISGNNKCYIRKSFNSGAVSAEENAGGIAGIITSSSICNSEIIDCFNTGNISSDKTSGGIAGKNENSGISFDTVIKTCYNTGKVLINKKESESYILGKDNISANALISDCCFKAVNGNKGADGIYPLSAEEFKNKEKLKGFDFENTWFISDESLYPQLYYNQCEIFVGSALNPVEITDENGFDEIRKNPNLNYILKNNIELVNFESIKIFGGTLNGNGYELKTTDGVNSIFEKATYTSVIENLNIRGNVSVTVSKNGVFTGINYGKIRNCNNYASINTKSGKTHVGAFAGQNSGNISNCSNYADLSFGGHYSGGICGYSIHTITSCGNFGNLTQIQGKTDTGGIVGQDQSGAKMMNCFNMGNINGGAACGGIIGNINSGKTLINCFNSGNISSDTNGKAGGIVATVLKSGVSIENCYNSGIIKSGNNVISDSSPIYHSYSENSLPNVKNCYFLSSEGSGAVSLTPLTMAEMKKEEAFKNWDFINIWTFGLYDDYEYPVLQNEHSLPGMPKLYGEFENDINPFALNLSSEERMKLLRKYAVMCFFEINKGNSSYKLSDCGIMYSEADNGYEKLSTYDTDINNFGVLLYGTDLSDDLYYIKPYAEYIKDGAKITVYGKVKTFNVKAVK